MCRDAIAGATAAGEVTDAWPNGGRISAAWSAVSGMDASNNASNAIRCKNINPLILTGNLPSISMGHLAVPEHPYSPVI
jgi:hypothetical protein